MIKKIELIEPKLKLLIAAVSAGVLIAYVPISILFIALILGFLLIPVVVVFTSLMQVGLPVILKGLRTVLISGKKFFVISVSDKVISLEPQFR